MEILCSLTLHLNKPLTDRFRVLYIYNIKYVKKDNISDKHYVFWWGSPPQQLVKFMVIAHYCCPQDRSYSLNVQHSPSILLYIVGRRQSLIRESVDSLCRDGVDMPMTPYIGIACTRPNIEDLSLFRYLTIVYESLCTQ